MVGSQPLPFGLRSFTGFRWGTSSGHHPAPIPAVPYGWKGTGGSSAGISRDELATMGVHGAGAYFDVDLSAGDYVLVCLITGRDEVSHAAKGMVQHIRIG